MPILFPSLAKKKLIQIGVHISAFAFYIYYFVYLQTIVWCRNRPHYVQLKGNSTCITDRITAADKLFVLAILISLLLILVRKKAKIDTVIYSYVLVFVLYISFFFLVLFLGSFD